jgi:hypothetical protein
MNKRQLPPSERFQSVFVFMMVGPSFLALLLMAARGSRTIRSRGSISSFAVAIILVGGIQKLFQKT